MFDAYTALSLVTNDVVDISPNWWVRLKEIVIITTSSVTSLSLLITLILTYKLKRLTTILMTLHQFQNKLKPMQLESPIFSTVKLSEFRERQSMVNPQSTDFKNNSYNNGFGLHDRGLIINLR